MNPRTRAYIELLIVVLIWGVAPSVIKFTLGELPPFLFLTYRFLITTIVLLPFYLKSKNKGVTFSNLYLIILVSFLGSTLNLGLLFFGTNLTTSLDSSLISATSPILVILAGIIFLKEHVTKREKFGILITILGTIVITLQSFFEAGAPGTHSVLGNIIILLSNLAFAAYLIISKKALKEGVSPFTLTFMMFIIGFITCLPVVFIESKPSEILPLILNLNLSSHLSVLYMALISGALAYFLYQKAQKTIEASEASVFNYLPPIITAPVAMLWLHEKLTLPYLLGSVVIAAGVFLAEWKKQKAI
jgi:drug/metabolite transporter (DMT)-like permease